MAGTGKLMVKKWSRMVDNGTNNGKTGLVMVCNQCSGMACCTNLVHLCVQSSGSSNLTLGALPLQNLAAPIYCFVKRTWDDKLKTKKASTRTAKGKTMQEPCRSEARPGQIFFRKPSQHGHGGKIANRTWGVIWEDAEDFPLLSLWVWPHLVTSRCQSCTLAMPQYPTWF